MSDCRVETLVSSNSPILLIAPHLEEENTDFIAEYIAEQLDVDYVINKGWERSNYVDYLNDKANCNDVNQLVSDEVLQSEFLTPIIKFGTNNWNRNAYVFIIHGFGSLNKVVPDIVLGTGGAGRLSCAAWKKDVFAHFVGAKGIDIREGIRKFAGGSKFNLNQYFRMTFPNIHSFQIEIEHKWRKNTTVARVMAQALKESIGELLTVIVEPPDDFSYPMIQYP